MNHEKIKYWKKFFKPSIQFVTMESISFSKEWDTCPVGSVIGEPDRNSSLLQEQQLFYGGALINKFLEDENYKSARMVYMSLKPLLESEIRKSWDREYNSIQEKIADLQQSIDKLELEKKALPVLSLNKCDYLFDN